MQDLAEAVERFILVYISAMVANGTPVIVMRNRRGHPIDMGRTFGDGRRILGDSKTIEGFLSGVASGLAIGLAVLLAFSEGYGVKTAVLTALASSTGAMTGDLAKSFIKRRLGIEAGAPLPLADQLDFYLGATLFVVLVPGTLKPSLWAFLTGLLVIPPLHVATNTLAHRLGLKKVPY